MVRSPSGTKVVFFDYLFGSWLQAGTFTASHPSTQTNQARVDVDGDIAVLATQQGANRLAGVRVLVRTNRKWVQRAKLLGSENGYGASIGLSRDPATPGRVLVGAPVYYGSPSKPGFAYVYDPVDPKKLGQWTVRKLSPKGCAYTGRSVALSGGFALLGGDLECVSNYHRAFAFELGGRKQSGSISSYGSSCQGSGGKYPRVDVTGTPDARADVTWTLSNARANVPAVHIIGSKRQSIMLDAIGMKGCWLLTDLAVSNGHLTDGTGTAAVKARIPCDPRSIGAKITSQYAVVDFGAPNPLKVVSTNGVEVTIGGFK